MGSFLETYNDLLIFTKISGNVARDALVSALVPSSSPRSR